ncbi:SusC/RagA family TonB-linked outer membrane protein [Dysgonomonas macrotermitis]|uniref:TonB-linked outer membrane protein, SusC/RagA family n=1 Tax=Dysgonomonas macrotermitis TaxID=1346286 RepID=A0A1M4XYU5_9BACT|nr:TonB-dependent receptor [Dysgonomonas macrotermitis]SHE98737.1 TonB-linked outer membrane protein, SusC/RagA family [Dysgonomonas macrotermitis]
MSKSNLKFRLRAAITILLFFVSGVIAFAQNVTVSGTVTDQQNEPLIGVSVVVKGTTTGTVTDLDGKYSILAAKGATIVFSYIGFNPQQAIVSGVVLNVQMQSSDSYMDEVVVVGTVMKKSDLTGAVGGINAKVLAEKPVTSVNQALQGRLAGVFISQGAKPTDEASIRIRGINTIDGSTDPIYVVDGIVMDNWYGGFNATNVADIASVEVLKDASATALYGSRGANGVVVITTKKGQAGEGKVSYDGWVGFQSFGHQPKLMNTQQLYDTRSQAYINGYIDSYSKTNGGVAPSQSLIDNYINSEIKTPDRVFTSAELKALEEGRSYNWLDEMLRSPAIQQNHVLSFSRGSESGSFYLSFGYMNNKGLIKKTEQTKYTGRFNADQLIKPWLKVGTNTSFTYTYNSKLYKDEVFYMARGASPFLEPNDTDLWTSWSSGTNNDHNPLRSLRIDNDERMNRLVSSNYINIEPIKGLNIRSTFSIDYGTAGRNSYVPNDISEAQRDSHDGRATDNRDTRTVWQWDNSISYNHTFNKVHQLNAMVGTSATSTKTNWLNAQADGFFLNNLTYHNMNANLRKDRFGLKSDWNEQGLMSYITRVSYSYKSRYLLTGTVRADGSSKFADGHKWGTFPSFSGAWNIAEEGFMADQNIFDQLKLRAGFGVVGNQNIGDFMYQTLYLISGVVTETGYTPTSTLEDGRRGTPDISWEKQQQWNIGLDMVLLDSRLNLSVDAYLIDNKDLLMTRMLPGISGYQKATENVGAIRNKGFEASLNAHIIQGQDFTWDASATFSLDRNKVTSLYGGRRFIYKLQDQTVQNEGNLFVGQPRNTFYMMPSAGIAQQSDMWYVNTLDLGGREVSPGDLLPIDVNHDGRITEDGDRIVVGSKDPKFYGGFSTDLGWRGLSLNMVFTYSYGAKRVGGWYNDIVSGYGKGMTSADLINNTWTPENTGAEFPRLLARESSGSQRWGQGELDSSLWDASFLRMSALTLSYTFPEKILSNIHMSNLRAYVTGSNLFCITPYKGYDPEFGDSYPSTRMWTFGVNMSF